jgi:hypothetical protein
MHLLKTAGTPKHKHCTTEKQQRAPWALLSAESAPIKLIPPPHAPPSSSTTGAPAPRGNPQRCPQGSFMAPPTTPSMCNLTNRTSQQDQQQGGVPARKTAESVAMPFNTHSSPSMVLLRLAQWAEPRASMKPACPKSLCQHRFANSNSTVGCTTSDAANPQPGANISIRYRGSDIAQTVCW